MEKNHNSVLNKIFKKMPRFKFNKLKMEDIENLEELKNVDYTKIEPPKPKMKKGEHYQETNYQTVKDIYLHTMQAYSKRTFILDKINPKDEKFKEYSFREFGDDVERLGTVLIQKTNLESNRIVIIGENQYDWYVSYMTALMGAGIAVPVDKELPENEIENVVNRAKATVIIFSKHLKDKMKNIVEKVPTVQYFIEMKSDYELDGKFIGFDTMLSEGRKLISDGEDSFLKIGISPEEFKALFFTSGTTSNSKGVMVNNRQLANNINAISAYAKVYETDRFFSVLPLHHTYESSIGFLLPFACRIFYCCLSRIKIYFRQFEGNASNRIDCSSFIIRKLI